MFGEIAEVTQTKWSMAVHQNNLGSAGRAGLRERMEVEGPAGVGFTYNN